MTHIKYEDLKLALEALESTRIIDFSVEDIVSWKKAITAFKQALAAQPTPVPMAHIVGEIDHSGKVWTPSTEKD